MTVCSDQVLAEPQGDLQGDVVVGIPQQVQTLSLLVDEIIRSGQQDPAVLVQQVILPPTSPGPEPRMVDTGM